MTKKVMVLMGGFSSEREVSLNGGKAIAKALKQKSYNVIEHDLTDVKALLKALEQEKPDVIFNALHGNWGEDGTISALFDLLQIPYTHSGMLASAIGMNKYVCKLIAKNSGIRVASSQKTTAKEFQASGTTIDYPYVVKPVSDGSSVGVFIVNNQQDALLVKYKNMNTEILIEKYIEGQELTVMCYKNFAHVVTEIKPTEDFYDYEHKYQQGGATHILPANLPNEISEICKAYAQTMHNKLGCKTVSRSDFRYNPTDGIIFLEINTHPGMTELSLVPEQAKYIGISYEDLCQQLVEDASCRPLK
jgi:D-alanine-D-alanine ligase